MYWTEVCVLLWVQTDHGSTWNVPLLGFKSQHDDPQTQRALLVFISTACSPLKLLPLPLKHPWMARVSECGVDFRVAPGWFSHFPLQKSIFILFFLQHDDLITNIKHGARCTAAFQESVSGDVGCNRGEARERLVWRCIWNTWVIRDAVSYSVLQHPLRCPPHSATVHIKCIYALRVPAPLPHPSNIAFSCHTSFSCKTPGAAGGWKGEGKVKMLKTSCSWHSEAPIIYIADFYTRLRSPFTCRCTGARDASLPNSPIIRSESAGKRGEMRKHTKSLPHTHTSDHRAAGGNFFITPSDTVSSLKERYLRLSCLWKKKRAWLGFD